MPLTLAAWLHNLSPFLVRFTDTLGLRWYGLAYATGFVLGWLWLRWMGRRGMTPLSPQRISDAMLLLVLGVVVGGRLGYVLFYEPKLLVSFSSSPPWWGLFQLNKGGMASHGGMLGVIIATWFIARGPRDASGQRSQRLPWLHILDLTAVACTVGLMLGRIANFINGELLGRIVAMPGEPAPWWAIKFPQERDTGDPLLAVGHAPPLTDAQTKGLAALIDAHRIGPIEPDSAAYERLLHKLQAGGVEGARIAAALDPFISARYPSQLMQAATDGLILGGILWLIWRRPRKPGVIGCWFLVLYGLLRISTEFVRLPDPQLTWLKENTGFSMGQWLSVLMVAVGGIALPIIARRDVAKFKGWSGAALPGGA
jgi:phosphatidylglycerol:prolipoprotein diacylglycerol transferase